MSIRKGGVSTRRRLRLAALSGRVGPRVDDLAHLGGWEKISETIEHIMSKP